MSTEATLAKRELIYDAVLYGLGAALNGLAQSELGKRIAEEVHKSFGGTRPSTSGERGSTGMPRGVPSNGSGA